MKRIKSGFVETSVLVGFAIIVVVITVAYFSQKEKLASRDSRNEISVESVGEQKTLIPDQEPTESARPLVVAPPVTPTTSSPTPKPSPVVVSPVSPVVAPSGVRLISSTPCSGSTCYTLGVTCEGITEKQIMLQATSPASPKGTVVLGTGGHSNVLYSRQSTEQNQTVKTLVDNNFEVFELYWKNGWPSASDDAGFRKAMCGYAEAVQWIASSKAKQPQTMCAQGNSAGGFAIGYGLSLYGLENILDMVVLSGGPPTSRLDVSCFGSTDPALQGAVWSLDIAGRQIVDVAMGWSRTGSYCKKGGPSSADRVKALQDTSLVSPTETRDYSFPRTKVNFVNSETDYANATGKLYYDVITTAKAWYQIPGDEHGVDQTAVGAKKIRDLFLTECVAR